MIPYHNPRIVGDSGRPEDLRRIQGTWSGLEATFERADQLMAAKKEIGTMDSKPAQNIQDTFLNTVRKDKSPDYDLPGQRG